MAMDAKQEMQQLRLLFAALESGQMSMRRNRIDVTQHEMHFLGLEIRFLEAVARRAAAPRI
jgi:hypothetical protein